MGDLFRTRSPFFPKKILVGGKFLRNAMVFFPTYWGFPQETLELGGGVLGKKKKPKNLKKFLGAPLFELGEIKNPTKNLTRLSAGLVGPQIFDPFYTWGGAPMTKSRKNELDFLWCRVLALEPR